MSCPGKQGGLGHVGADLRTYKAELHVHTVLSPCAEVEMVPPLIVRRALSCGIDVIAITDHNASANVRAVQLAARDTGLVVLPGMELQTREEVHLLCLFDHLSLLEEWQEMVDKRMPVLQNDADLFGEQFVVDETGEFVRREFRLLLTSADMSLAEAVAGVRALNGLAVPAHVDRKAFSLIANLGLIPADLALEGLEISRSISPDAARRTLPQVRGYALLQNGDAHRLDEIVGMNRLSMAQASIEEIKLALRGSGGRSVRIDDA